MMLCREQVIAACEDIRVARQLALVWGVFPIVVGKHDAPFSVTHEIDKARQVFISSALTLARDANAVICAQVAKILRELGVTTKDSDLLTFVVGLPWGFPGSTNMIRVTSAAGTGHILYNPTCNTAMHTTIVETYNPTVVSTITPTAFE